MGFPIQSPWVCRPSQMRGYLNATRRALVTVGYPPYYTSLLHPQTLTANAPT